MFLKHIVIYSFLQKAADRYGLLLLSFLKGFRLLELGSVAGFKHKL